MREKVHWKNAAMIVVTALLLAVPIGGISYSFGAGSGSKTTSGVVAPTLNYLNQAKADQAQAAQLWKDAKAQSDKVKGMSLNDNEKELQTLGDKIIAAAAAGQKANADLIAGFDAMMSAGHK